MKNVKVQVDNDIFYYHGVCFKKSYHDTVMCILDHTRRILDLSQEEETVEKCHFCHKLLEDHPTTTVVYFGKLIVRDYNMDSEENLYLEESNDPLCEIIEKDIEQYGNSLSLSYYISETPIEDEDELQEKWLDKLEGIGEAEFYVLYSEYTGYLWTTEAFKIGGHDLFAELCEQVGKYCFLTITYQ
jgi:hypothetical protein